MLRKVLFTILTAAAAIYLALLVVAFAQGYRARAFGNEFLADVRNLRVGQSTYQDALRVQAKYRSRSSSGLGDCDQNQCILAFSGGNERLYRLRLVPGDIFTGGVTVRHGVLVRISVSYWSNYYHAATEETVGNSAVDAYEVRHQQVVSVSDLLYKAVWVRITSAATPAQREKAYSYNLACLTKLGGCKDANEILPRLRKLTEADRPSPPPPD